MNILKTLVTGFGFIIGFLLLFGLFIPTNYVAESSILIKTNPAAIHPYVSDLKAWPKWEPWQHQDPSIKTIVSDQSIGTGASQSWTGDSGQGELHITRSEADFGIEFDLFFNQKTSQAKSGIYYLETDGGTRVIWKMTGDMKMPIVGGYFAALIKSMVRDSYDQGLSNLKAVVEAGT